MESCNQNSVFDWEKKSGFPAEVLNGDLPSETQREINKYLKILASDEYQSFVSESGLDPNKSIEIVLNTIARLETGRYSPEDADKFFYDSRDYLDRGYLDQELSQEARKVTSKLRFLLIDVNFENAIVESNANIHQVRSMIRTVMSEVRNGAISPEAALQSYRVNVDLLTSQ